MTLELHSNPPPPPRRLSLVVASDSQSPDGPAAESEPQLSRHPGDGFQLAPPYPMSERVRSKFRALIRVLLPPAPAPHTPDMIDRVELYVRRFMAHMPALAARGMWLAIVVLDWAPRLLFVSLRRLCKLDREQANRVLTKMAESSSSLLRTPIVGVRALVLSAYFDQDEVHRALHYRPVPFLRGRIALRRQLLAGAS
jgi:hypothetical protein